MLSVARKNATTWRSDLILVESVDVGLEPIGYVLGITNDGDTGGRHVKMLEVLKECYASMVSESVHCGRMCRFGCK